MYLSDGSGKFLLNQESAEEFFCCSQHTLINWRKKGLIEFREVGKGTYYYIVDPNKCDEPTGTEE